MDADPLAMLWEATLASSAALLLVLAMRRPVRALLGASAAYALWLCVPVVVLAVLLPRGMDAPLALPAAWQVAPVGAVAALQPRAQWHWHQWLLPLWAAGVLVAMALQGWRQQRFQRGLGVVQRGDDGLYRSTSATAGLPAVIGLVRPRILLPADFDRRYTAQEKVLVIAHERLHVRRGDLLANALAALLGCLFWFNPLLPFAMRRFRLDQELACDGRVIARHPHARRQYGEAMLKTQVDPSLLPLGCHWQASHPLKERIDMLKRPIPSPLHWLASMLLALVVTAATGYLAWATQPPAPSPLASMAGAGPLYSVDVRMDVDGNARAVRLRERAGRTFVLRSADGTTPAWKAEFVVGQADDPAQAWVAGTIHIDGSQASTPRMLVALGEPARITTGAPGGGPVATLELTVLRLGGDQDATGGRQQPTDAMQVPARIAAAQADPEQAAVIDMTRPPAYPPEAARQGIGGEVILQVSVAPDGSLRDVQVERAEPAGVFEQVSLEAARQWRFRPAMRDGSAVEGRVRIPVTFAIPEDDTDTVEN